MNTKEAKMVFARLHKLQMEGKQMPCPCCGKEMRSNLEENSMSRYYDIYICSECGMVEALVGAIPLKDWVVIKGIEDAHRVVERAVEHEEPAVIIVRDKMEDVYGVLLVTNGDGNLAGVVEEIEKNWASVCEAYREREETEDDFFFDEEDEHFAYIEDELKRVSSDSSGRPAYNIKDVDNYIVLDTE